MTYTVQNNNNTVLGIQTLCLSVQLRSCDGVSAQCRPLLSRSRGDLSRRGGERDLSRRGGDRERRRGGDLDRERRVYGGETE